MNLYTPILVLGAIAAAFAVGSVGIAVLIGPKRYNRAKLEAYECGIEPMDASDPAAAATGQRFPIRYYLTAMLFIVFDIEIVFLYPFTSVFHRLGTFGLLAVVEFAVAVFASFLYLIANGALDWGPAKQARRGELGVDPTRTSTSTIRRVGLEGREPGPDDALVAAEIGDHGAPHTPGTEAA